eukprot:TRINITY_DN449_c0_g1_i2.p1 TRINITY_DN449_c0_g1~~TRINITY_DN449_c0_g1_i2.p1  ORF type:complete len:214 (+),score=31.48 TRINITY_DN449_c0_g1_i2:385-1026(+)
MAEVAYLSFVQLAQGDKPLLRIAPPDTKPRTRAAAISPEGYAFKDYLVQVTKFGFDFMNAKMNCEGLPTKYDVQPAKKVKREVQGTTSTTSQTNQAGADYYNQQQLAVPYQNQVQQFVPRLTEQEQEIANVLFAQMKNYLDSLISIISNLRTENDTLRRENLNMKYSNNTLTEECRIIKINLLQMTGNLTVRIVVVVCCCCLLLLCRRGSSSR